MPRYRLCTLLILLAVLPPVLAGMWWAYQDHCQQQRRAAARAMIRTDSGGSRLVLAELSSLSHDYDRVGPVDTPDLDLPFDQKLLDERGTFSGFVAP